MAHYYGLDLFIDLAVVCSALVTWLFLPQIVMTDIAPYLLQGHQHISNALCLHLPSGTLVTLLGPLTLGLTRPRNG